VNPERLLPESDLRAFNIAFSTKLVIRAAWETLAQ
jgi:hypothetical protein